MSPRSAAWARGASLAALGLAAGYLLWKAHRAGFPGRLALPSAAWLDGRAQWLADLSANAEISRYAMYVITQGMHALPAALLVGIPIGLVMRAAGAAHARLLLYATLAWPLGIYAYRSMAMYVFGNLSEQEHVSLWHARGMEALEAFALYSVFFCIAYLSRLAFRCRVLPIGKRASY